MFKKTQTPLISDLYRIRGQIDIDNTSSWEDLCARDAAIGEKCELKDDLGRLLFWLRELVARGHSDEDVVNESRLALLVAAVAFFLGFSGMGSFLLSREDHYVDVLLFLFIFVLIQIILCLVSIWVIYRCRGGRAPSGASINPMKYLLSRSFPDKTFYKEFRSLIRLMTLRYGQEVGVVFTLGAIMAFYLTTLTGEYGFYWGSTANQISSDVLYELVNVASFPWQAIAPQAVISFEDVQVSNLYLGAVAIDKDTLKLTQQWHPFLLISMIVYALLPRLMLWVVTTKMYRNGVRISVLNLPGNDLVIMRMFPQKLTTAPVFSVIGTSVKAKSSLLKILDDDQQIFELIDTAGLPRASSIMQSLKELDVEVSGRPAVLAKFLEDNKGELRFRDDFRTLRPIIDGAGIIYAVDGTDLCEDRFDAEMELLRWTGKYALAVLVAPAMSKNVDKWLVKLNDQFPEVVAVYDEQAYYSKKTMLLRLLEALNPGWRASFSKALHILKGKRLESHNASAELIEKFISEGLTYRVFLDEKKLKSKRKRKVQLDLEYKKILEINERSVRDEVLKLYERDDISSKEIDELNLFKTRSKDVFGPQMKSSLRERLAWFFGKHSSKIVIRKSGREAIGYSYLPGINSRFAFVLLGRSLYYHEHISSQVTVPRDNIRQAAPLNFLTKEQRRIFSRLFSNIKNHVDLEDNRNFLRDNILGWCKSVDEH